MKPFWTQRNPIFGVRREKNFSILDIHSTKHQKNAKKPSNQIWEDIFFHGVVFISPLPWKCIISLEATNGNYCKYIAFSYILMTLNSLVQDTVTWRSAFLCGKFHQTEVFFYGIVYRVDLNLLENLHINKFYCKIGRLRAYDAKKKNTKRIGPMFHQANQIIFSLRQCFRLFNSIVTWRIFLVVLLFWISYPYVNESIKCFYFDLTFSKTASSKWSKWPFEFDNIVLGFGFLLLYLWPVIPIASIYTLTFDTLSCKYYIDAI